MGQRVQLVWVQTLRKRTEFSKDVVRSHKPGAPVEKCYPLQEGAVYFTYSQIVFVWLTFPYFNCDIKYKNLVKVHKFLTISVQF